MNTGNMLKSLQTVNPTISTPLTADTKYAVIVSHNSRIQCLLDNFKPAKTKIRFQNGCVLRISISTISAKECTISVKLLYSGTITESDNNKDKKIFYCAARDGRIDTVKYVLFDETTATKTLMEMSLGTVQLTSNYVFYVVRHGQSEHNKSGTLAGTLHLKPDTSLLNNDDPSLQPAAKAIQADLSDHPIDAYFVSDLLRTHQTLNILMKTLGNRLPIVLPCASEVAQVGKNGDCDSSAYLLQKGALENYPSCTLTRIKLDTKCKADWTVYLKFYGGQMRGYDSTASGIASGIFSRGVRGKTARMRCRNTNMLAMAIYSMDFNQRNIADFMYISPLGGRKWTRKNRRKRSRVKK